MKIRISPRVARRMLAMIHKAPTVADIYGMWSPIWGEKIRAAMQQRLGELSQ